MLSPDTLRMVRETLKASEYESVLDAARRVRSEANVDMERMIRIRAILHEGAAPPFDFDSSIHGSEHAEDMAERLNRIAAIVEADAPRTSEVPLPDRERLGQEVRRTWIEWALEQPEQPAPKPSWLVPWEELSEADRQVDRRIGERLFDMGVAAGNFAAGQVAAQANSAQERLQLAAEQVRAAIAEAETLLAEKASWAAEARSSMRLGAETMRKTCAEMLRGVGDGLKDPVAKGAFGVLATAIENLSLPPD